MIILFARLVTCRLVKEFIYLSRGLRINSRYLGKIRQARPFDGFHSAKMAKQGAFARGPDPRDFLKSGFADAFLAPNTMRADGEPVGLVAQPLDEIQRRIARRHLEGRLSGQEKCFASCIAIGP